MVLEPILKEPGDIAFTWLEIYRTKVAFLQQVDVPGNSSATIGNETFGEYNFYPKEIDCEFKCPEIDACISGILWCDGKCVWFNCALLLL